MFILTERRAGKEFDRLLNKLDSFEPQIAHWKEEVETASKLGFETDDSRYLIRELEKGQLEMATDLRKARLGIRMGAHHWREALPLLKACKVGVQFLEAHLNQLDASTTAAKHHARQLFGKT